MDSANRIKSSGAFSHKVLVIGSYNGQESYGDKCLLKSVVNQFTRSLGAQTSFIVHLHQNIAEGAKIIPQAKFSLGMSHLFWTWHVKLRHTHLPSWIRVFLALITLPLYIAFSRQARRAMEDIIRDCRSVSCLYFYGGTQLSEKWFWFNFVPLALTILLCRMFNARVFFGPQQYGPQSPSQVFFFKLLTRVATVKVRTRNSNDIRLLGLSRDCLLYDEVYSCVDLYPLVPTRCDPDKYILVNFRSSNFASDIEPVEIQTLARVLMGLQEEFSARLVFFQMSDESFCDDASVVQHVLKKGIDPLTVSMLEYHIDDRQLIDMAQGALGVISMSFHGCILAMIGGCPAVPINSGGYYTYKYNDFSRYSGGQSVPVVDLATETASQIIQRTVSYFRNYHSELTATTRLEAVEKMARWYSLVAKSL